MRAITKACVRSLSSGISWKNSFSTMSALRAKTAGLLLDHISEQERVAFIRDVTRSLDAQSSNADIGLAAALWKLHPDKETQDGLVSHLRRMIEEDDTDRVAAVCKDYSELEKELTGSAIPRIATAAGVLQSNSRLSLAVSLLASTQSHSLNTLDGKIENTIEQSKQLLGFLKRVSCERLELTQVASLLQSCLVLVGAVDRNLSQLTREILFSLFDLPRAFDAPEQQVIWKRIESLATCENTYYKSLGFSLWLRWLSAQRAEPSILQDPKYWGLIVDGLRKGDSERRKSALQILRASINATIADPLLTSMIVADSQAAPPSK